MSQSEALVAISGHLDQIHTTLCIVSLFLVILAVAVIALWQSGK